MKYQTSRVGSCFRRVIEPNQKMLIVDMFLRKRNFIYVMVSKIDVYLQK